MPEEKQQKKYFTIVSIVRLPSFAPEEEETYYSVLVRLWNNRPIVLRLKESELSIENIKNLVMEEIKKMEQFEGQVVEL